MSKKSTMQTEVKRLDVLCQELRQYTRKTMPESPRAEATRIFKALVRRVSKRNVSQLELARMIDVPKDALKASMTKEFSSLPVMEAFVAAYYAGRIKSDVASKPQSIGREPQPHELETPPKPVMVRNLPEPYQSALTCVIRRDLITPQNTKKQWVVRFRNPDTGRILHITPNGNNLDMLPRMLRNGYEILPAPSPDTVIKVV